MSRRRTVVSHLRFEASGKSPEPEQPEDKMQSEIGHQNSQWRCRQCGTLLGVATGDEVEVRYKTAVYRVRGELATDCRKCGTANRLDTRNAHPRNERRCA